MEIRDSKLKIIATGTRGFPNVQGGVEAHCEHLYPFLVKKGCTVTVITRKTYVDPTLKEYEGVKLIPVNNPRKKSLEAIIHTFKAVIKAKQLGCDVLHIHAIGPALLVPLARLLGLKVVVTNHGPDYDRQKWGGFAKGMLRLGEYFGSKGANKVISISGPIAESLKRKYNCEAEIIPNGVVIPEIAETDKVLKQFGLEKGKYILAVGRFVPEKGFHDLLDGFAKTQKESWKLVIAGDADHEDQYSLNLKMKAKRVQNVVLTGFQKGQSLQELFSHAGLFILPSYHEGLPIVLLEAMSYGLSCIVSDIPANREVDLDESRYFKPGDMEGIAAKMREFIEKSLDAKERESQIEYIRENFDWEKIAAGTLEVYKKVVSGKVSLPKHIFGIIFRNTAA